MLIALFSLLFTLILNGPEQIFMAPEVEKGIKKHVVDTEKKKEILLSLKEAKKVIKKFNKEQLKIAKSIQKELLSAETDHLSIQKLLDSALQSRRIHEQKFIEGRLQFQAKLSQEEWDKIVKPAAFPSEKTKAKNQKRRNKSLNSNEEKLMKVDLAVKKAVTEEDRKEKILNSLKDFREVQKRLIKMRKELDYENQSILRKKEASKEELEEFYANNNELREETYTSFIKLVNQINENTSIKERKTIYKSLSKILKE